MGNHFKTYHPLVSVIIPAFNAAHFIKEAIDSVYRQDYNSIEIIVVNDGSKDQTGEIVKKIFPSVVLINQPNSGPSAARNNGIRRAMGEFISFLDADDIWIQGKITAQLETMKRHKNAALIASDMAEIDFEGNVTIPSILDHHHLLDQFQKYAGNPIPNALACMLNKNFIPTGTVLLKRDVIKTVGYFREDIRFGEDLEFWARIAAKYQIICLPDVHMLRRKHEHNTTLNNRPMLIDLVKVMTSIHGWAEELLKEQGKRSSDLVGKAYWNLGYSDFLNGDLKNAKRSFFRGFKMSYKAKYIIYSIAMLFPKKIINWIRTLKKETNR